MATKERVTKVWIEPGCIICDACETAAPDVFDVQEENCVIRPEALTPDFTKPRSQDIIDAAEECPVDVIKYDAVTEEVADEESAPAATPGAAGEAKMEGAAAIADSAPTRTSKSSEAPAEAPVPVGSTSQAADESRRGGRKTVPQPTTSAAGEPDAGIAALLRAATSRGGSAGIARKQDGVPEAVRAWEQKELSELPPEARQAKVLEAAKKARQDPDARRRSLISSAALATGWVAFGSGVGVAAVPAFLRFMMPNVLEEPDPRIRVGTLQRYLEMVPGDVIEDYKPQGIWMIRDRERIAALNIICTHLGCIPNWLPNDRKFKCPCHGSGFKPDGINFEGPTPRPLERFRIYLDEDLVVVDKSKKYQYELGQWDKPGSYLEV